MEIEFKKTSLPEGLKLKEPSTLIATWFGSGLITPAPGTWGTLAALPLGILLLSLGPVAFIVGFAVLFLVGFWAVDIVDRKSTKKDEIYIVVDEAIGIIVALFFCQLNIFHIAFAFALFRILDIWKPFPISLIQDNMRNPLGVILDDVVAGLITALTVLILRILNVF